MKAPQVAGQFILGGTDDEIAYSYDMAAFFISIVGTPSIVRDTGRSHQRVTAVNMHEKRLSAAAVTARSETPLVRAWVHVRLKLQWLFGDMSKWLRRTSLKPQSHYLNGGVYSRSQVFEDLPLYTSIIKHRQVGERFGLSDPFYRTFDASIGAKTLIDGRVYVNFASYDYLGLNRHPKVVEAAKAAIDRYGTSVSASRIVFGERPIHRELEQAIAAHYGTERALAFVSGHATNVTTIATLMRPGDVIFYDELAHNSVLVGAKLSGATSSAFRHNDMDALEELLRQRRQAGKNALIAVEGLYSMDGDIPDLPRLLDLKERYGAWLLVDEAHALGVLGKSGRGIAEHFDIDPTRVDIWMGTLSKALAGCGGYIAGRHALIELLKLQAAGQVYSVGMSPPVAAAALASLTLLKTEPERVSGLQANGRLFLAEAKARGLDTVTSCGYAITPVMVGDIIKVGRLTDRMMARGINVFPIIYPAVPIKAARLRFFITSEHTTDQIRDTVEITANELDRLSTAGAR